MPEELAFPGHDLLSLRRRDDGTAKPQSPSRLETLLVSPLAWLLAEVGAEDMSWSTEELDVMARGNIAHDVFEHVFLKDQPFPETEALAELIAEAYDRALTRHAGYGFGFGEDEEDSPSGMTDANLVGPAGFWTEAFTAESNDIYSHPAILAAVRQIEAYTRAGEKVLVFGRFLTPMNVLTRLLDAREMLRRLRDGQHWPASGIGESNIAAVIAAMRDPDLAVAGGVDEIDVMLKTRYQEWASERRAELARLHRELEDLALEGGTAAFLSEILRHEDGKQDLQFGALLEALGGRREVAGASWTGREMLGLFEKLLLELAGDDEAENNDTQKARLDAWLNDYSGREGNFARMMSGATAPQTRRMLQSAFNRSSSWPMVLLAQSRVGREGLNLHEACRTVILLHAEWNPGIVEQQIGRVDRKNSLWLREWRKWRDHGDGLPPRIRVHPVVVSGTYDDHNWQVLKARWLELRAQLHGDVLRPVPGRSEVIDDKRTYADRVRRAVPDFSPGERGG